METEEKTERHAELVSASQGIAGQARNDEGVSRGSLNEVETKRNGVVYMRIEN